MNTHPGEGLSRSYIRGDVFEVVIGSFLCSAGLLMVGGLFNLRWRLALQEEGIELPRMYYAWPDEFRGELRLLVRLFRNSGAGPGEKYRRWSRMCLIGSGLAAIAFVVSGIVSVS